MKSKAGEPDNKQDKRLLEVKLMANFEKFLDNVGITKSSLAKEMGITSQTLETSIRRGLSMSYQLRIETIIKRRAQLMKQFSFDAEKLKKIA